MKGETSRNENCMVLGCGKFSTIMPEGDNNFTFQKF